MPNRRRSFTLLGVGFWLAAGGPPGISTPVSADGPAALPIGEIHLTEGLALGNVGWSARWPVHRDPIEARIVAGTWTWPAPGDAVEGADGPKKTWSVVKADPRRVFKAGLEGGGYLAVRVASEVARVAMLHASGHGFVYVNGELHTGDPYAYGWLRLPVQLRKGDNEFLFRAGDRGVVASLEEPKAPVYVSEDDETVPDLDPTEAAGPHGRSATFAVVVVNASTATFRLRGVDGDGTFPGWGADRRPVVPPLSCRKIPVSVAVSDPLPGAGRLVRFVLKGDLAGDPAEASGGVTLACPPPPAVRRVTFTSGIDGSLQYYAVRPATSGRPGRGALVLSLHGASVEAKGQAEAYAAKSWATIVCPTNRRPYGFDWEDWGRLDAMEVLTLASGGEEGGRSRTYLTGHSMGGHGTWQLGCTFPDRFAAIGPSAGWISFGTYHGGAPKDGADPIEALFRRAASPSDTAALVTNLATQGVYVLHGDADDNVPVTEARAMVERLKPIVPDLHLHEEKGAGHWWDVSPAPGADCVDWPPMFDLFARRRVPKDEEVSDVDFTTSCPSVNATCRGVTIWSQLQCGVPARVRLRVDRAGRRVEGTTSNISRLALDPRSWGGPGPMALQLDGGAVPGVAVEADGRLVHLRRTDAGWAAEGPVSPREKGPLRSGPFKDAFRRNFCLVYGTRGTPEENAWGRAKARYDAETWAYRGNGSLDVYADAEFLAAPVAETENRDVVLYGHGEMNGAWSALLADSPIQLRRSRLVFGEGDEAARRSLSRDDVAVLFLRPRPGDDRGCVAVVAGTGLPGLRLCERMPYFTSGVAFPDWTVFSTEALTKGSAGVLGAGYFGDDWTVVHGESVWR